MKNNNDEIKSIEKYIDERAAKAKKQIDSRKCTLQGLFAVAKTGDEDARNLLFDYYSPQVIKTANKYASKLNCVMGVFDKNDMIQEGFIGLLDAINASKQMPEKALEAYIIEVITGYILNAYNEKASCIRLPRYIRKNYMKIRKQRENLQKVLNRDPTDDEIAQQCQISILEFRNTTMVCDEYLNLCSLEEPLSEGSDYTLSDFATKDEESEYESVESALLGDYIKKLIIKKLNHKDDIIIRMLFGIDYEREYTESEISEIIGTTRQYVCAETKRILKKLHKSLDVDAA